MMDQVDANIDIKLKALIL